MQLNPLAIGVSMLHLPLTIAAVVLFFRLKTDRDPRLRLALFAAAAMMGFELVALGLRFADFDRLRLVTVFFQDAVLFFKLWAMVYVGQVLWNRQGVDYWGTDFARARPQTLIWGGFAAVALLALYSTALFLWLKPSYGPVTRMLGTGDVTTLRQGVLVVLFLANFALAEELIYRGCIQPMLAHFMGGGESARWIALGLTCLLWTFMHLGMLELDWAKLVQVLPLGIFLGIWFRHAGFIGVASVHLAFNLLLAPIGSQLVSAE